MTIPGFGGEFEQSFNDLIGKNPGSAEVALRTPRIDLLDAATVTCHYAEGTIFGPSPRFYSHMEYLVWFLSKDSQWLPVSVRELLQRGMQEWDVWTNDDTYALGERPFFRQLWHAREHSGAFEFTQETREDLITIFSDCLTSLDLTDDPCAILEQFLALGYIGYFVEKRAGQRRRSKRKLKHKTKQPTSKTNPSND